MGFKEAFNQAARQNPNSPLARQIRETGTRISQENQQERRQQAIESLQNRVLIIGENWSSLNEYSIGLRPSLKARQVANLKSQWQRVLERLLNTAHAEQISILDQLAVGLGISEEHLSRQHRLTLIDSVLRNPLKDIAYKLSGKPQLTPASQMFLMHFCDLSGYSPEKIGKLEDFIDNRAESKDKVVLPQTLATISLWFQEQTPLDPSIKTQSQP